MSQVVLTPDLLWGSAPKTIAFRKRAGPEAAVGKDRWEGRRAERGPDSWTLPLKDSSAAEGRLGLLHICLTSLHVPATWQMALATGLPHHDIAKPFPHIPLPWLLGKWFAEHF